MKNFDPLPGVDIERLAPTLRKWRCVGVAGGFPVPKTKRIANKVFYTPRWCFEWRRLTTKESV